MLQRIVSRESKMACFLLLAFAAVSSGCTSMQPVSDQARYADGQYLEVGDTVEIETRNGETVSLKITEITERHIAGETDTVNVDDIVSVSVRKFSPTRTLVAVLTTTVAIAAAASGAAVPPVY